MRSHRSFEKRVVEISRASSMAFIAVVTSASKVDKEGLSGMPLQRTTRSA